MPIDRKKLAVAVGVTALAAIFALCAVRCSAVQQEREQQAAEQQAEQQAAEQEAQAAANASEEEKLKAQIDQEADEIAAKKAKTIEANKKQAEEEKRTAAKREAEAKAASTLVMLSDTEGLEGAGVPSEMAAQLEKAVSKWCAKHKVGAPDWIHKEDVTVDGDKCTVSLTGEKGVAEGSEDVPITASWNGKKLTVAKAKGGAR